MIAVNYEARACGIKSGMRGDEATKLCPDLKIFKVKEDKGKANLLKYRNASVEVMNVICNFNADVIVERASVDEAYLDLTRLINKMETKPPLAAYLHDCFVELPLQKGLNLNNKEAQRLQLKNWLHGLEENVDNPDLQLSIGAKIIKDIRNTVFEKTQFKCSAGISYSKTMAKLASVLHKPNSQTILPKEGISLILNKTPIHKIRNLGGKLGEDIKTKLNVDSIMELKNIPFAQLTEHFGKKTTAWLMDLTNGVDNEEVVARQLPKSIGCGKNFSLTGTI